MSNVCAAVDNEAQGLLAQWGVAELDPSGLYTFSNDSALVLLDPRPPEGPHLFKPEGLWYTDAGEDSWPNWCAGEDCWQFLKPYLYRLELNHAAVLQLTTAEQLVEFTEQYRTGTTGWSRTYEIDWVQVWHQHSGIEIIPYQWDCRLSPMTHWYYGWDCASGCVWRADAIRSMTLVGTNAKLTEEES